MTRDNSKNIQTVPTLLLIPMERTPEGAALFGIYNFLKKDFATCSLDFLFWLSIFMTPMSLEAAKGARPDLSEQEVTSQVYDLINLGFLSYTNTPDSLLSEHYRRHWQWDIMAGAFHFSSLNNEFMSLDESVSAQLDKANRQVEPKSSGLPLTGAQSKLPEISTSNAMPHLELLARRRTNRSSTGHILSAQEIGDCLFSAFGITHHVQTPTGPRPLSLAPSGGARNPYEAFVIIRRCKEFSAGVYHYTALTHTLTQVAPLDDEFSASALLGGQDWADDAAAIVLMVAILKRSMWKYQDSNAYRVLLIEAGHRAQNFMTTATCLGLTACPTAALAHDRIEELLCLTEPLMQTPVYALTLDRAKHLEDELVVNDVFASVYRQFEPRC